jgi:hypothetical protein
VDGERWEQRLLNVGHHTNTLPEKLRMEREKDTKNKRTEEEKTNPSVEVLEEALVITFKKHAVPKFNVVSQIEVHAMLCIPRTAQLKPGGRLT